LFVFEDLIEAHDVSSCIKRGAPHPSAASGSETKSRDSSAYSTNCKLPCINSGRAVRQHRFALMQLLAVNFRNQSVRRFVQMTYLGNDIGPIEPISNPRHRQSKRFGFNMAFR
jgi:hypothetical protein